MFRHVAPLASFHYIRELIVEKRFFMKQFLMMAALTMGLCGFQAQAETHSIVVNGVAEKSLDPNMVQLNISVWSKAGNAKQAQSLAATAFKQVKKTFDEFKVKKEDIQTTGYTLSPNYEFDDKAQRNKLAGYQVTQNLVVVLRKIDETGNFLDALVVDKKTNESGVTVSSLVWDSDKREQVVNTVLGDAVRSAKAKAEEIAKAAGVKIRGVSKISHNTTDNNMPQPVYRNFAAGMMKAAGDSTEVSSGQVSVRVEVNAEYEIQ
jgi:uncharacterized protein YggE